jgi:Ca-activated chloride channel family protein
VTSKSNLWRSCLYLKCCLFLCIFLLASSVGKTQSFPAPSPIEVSPTISVASDLVLLPVSVTDMEGNFVPGLSKENFNIYEEKQLQNLTVFQSEDAPVSVGLIVDHSGSMGPKLPNVIAAISAFAHSANPEDEMFVVDFDDKVTIEPTGDKPFTNDSTELGKAVEGISAGGRTALYDAVAEGLTHLQLSHWPKKALIVISDGGDNASVYKRSEILALARRSQVAIYSIVLIEESGKEQNPGALLRLCKDTGGLAFFPKSQQLVMDLSMRIAKDLRQQYTLGFVPEKNRSASSFRRIRVHVATPDGAKLSVRTRSGYSFEK